MAAAAFTVAVSGSSKTGGPEALHQLAAALAAQGHRTQMLYLGVIDEAVVAHYRRRYGLPTTVRPEDAHGHHLVLPEVEDPLPWMARPFVSRWVWWLSEVRHHPLRAYDGWGFLFQSRAIRAAFASCGQLGLLLTDHLIDDFRTPAPSAPRGPVIAFNAQRTSAWAALVLRNSGFELKPIGGMETPEVLAALDAASVYLDFGWHPGMDRGPREAALRGCVVMVNRARNAANPDDVPLPDRYKLDWIDRQSLVELIADACARRQDHLVAQAAYRTWILDDRQRFAGEVAAFAASAGAPPARPAVDSDALDRWQVAQTRDLLQLLRNINVMASGNLHADSRQDALLAENIVLRAATAPRLVRSAMRINGWMRRFKPRPR